MYLPAYAWIISALLAVVLSWWVYHNHWRESLYWKLAAFLRFFVVFVTTLLLFNPSWKANLNKTNNARWDVYVDWSKSTFKDTKAIKIWIDSLKEQHPEVEFQVFAFAEDLVDFKLRNTLGGNLSRLDLPIESMQVRKMQSQLSVLLTDGIQNQGRMLSSFPKETLGPIWCIGLGDTSAQKDIYVRDLLANKDVYAGNATEIEARVDANGFVGKPIQLEWLLNQNVVKSETWIPASSKETKRISYLLQTNSNSPEWLNVQLRARPIPQEINPLNNAQSALIKLRDQKKIIDIVYSSPHPDVKSIQLAMSEKQAYQIRLYSEYESLKKDADIYIAHGLKNVSTIELIKNSEKPVWWFVNNGIILKQLLASSTIGGASKQFLNGSQEVFPFVNQKFESFEMPDQSEISKIWGPVDAPLFTMNLNSDQVQMYQNWDGETTQVPLMWSQKNKRAEHLFLGSGFWKWRLNEARKNNTSFIFDAWITKNLQWLARASDGKKGWEFYAADEVLNIGEKLKFKWIYYDESGEKRLMKGVNTYAVIEGKKMILPIYVENQEYISVFSAKQTGLIDLILEDMNGKVLAKSKIQVNGISRELQQTQAQHQSLRELAERTKGEYGHFKSYHSSSVHTLDSKGFDIPVSKKIEKYIPLERFWPLILLLVLSFTGEWILRKWLGKI